MTLYEDQEGVLKDCTERFDRLGIAYMLTGSMAMAAYAMIRMQMRDVASLIRNGYDESYVGIWAKKLDIEDILKDCIILLGENYVEGYDA